MKILAFAFLFLGIAGFIVGFIAYMTGQEERDRQRTGAEDPRARKIRKNHAAMARLLDKILNDEMMRVTIPSNLQEGGRDLLAQYYEDGDTK